MAIRIHPGTMDWEKDLNDKHIFTLTLKGLQVQLKWFYEMAK